MKYLEQKARMMRLYDKVNESSVLSQREYEDNLYYFFQTAWHLKDWIKNDSSVECFDIEGIVNKTPSIRIAADLVNGKSIPKGKTTAIELADQIIRDWEKIFILLESWHLLYNTYKPKNDQLDTRGEFEQCCFPLADGK
jgi:guanylate kinase